MTRLIRNQTAATINALALQKPAKIRESKRQYYACEMPLITQLISKYQNIINVWHARAMRQGVINKLTIRIITN